MKIKNLNILLILSVIIFAGCSKPVAKTSAKVKLNLSKIVNFSSGIGSGGAILFGRSSTGEQFGKFITNSEENLELPNGDWNFYAVMWEKVIDNFDGKAYCGKSSQKLAGGAISINLSLNNGNCADHNFSGGDWNISGGITSFAPVYMEECDELNQAGSISCSLNNQGSALSYRLVFKSYKKNPGGGISFTGDNYHGACKKTSSVGDIHIEGLGVNFPSGLSAMPFVVSVEMFLGTANCGGGSVDPKGMYTHTFVNGIGANTSAANKLVKSPASTCAPSYATEALCESSFAVWTGTCSAPKQTITYFNDQNCSPSPQTDKYIKQMVSIPKPFLCRFNDTANTGADSFPGGDGSTYRPYKICNEWQMNQIGEYDSALSNSKNYKLMNDLDMNKAGLGGYPAPQCAGQDDYDLHMNLNPIDKINCYAAGNGAGYTGVFNGNNKTIANGRISSDDETLDYMGFSRSNYGTIKNLNFKGLEVRAGSWVGGVAGYLGGTGSTIKNVTMNKVEVSGEAKVGGLVGEINSDGIVFNSKVINGDVDGEDIIGGIAGINGGAIEKVMYRGSVTTDRYASSTYAGGIAGTSSGFILNSFSEGVISTSSDYIGGIAGLASGTIKVVYSTMAIVITKNIGAVKTGGLVGRLISGGDLYDCVADTSVIQYGGASPVNSHAVVGFIDSGTYTASSCVGDNAMAISPFAGVSYSALRTGAKPAGVTFSDGDGNWNFNSNSVPRLAWENRLCMLTANQQSVDDQLNLLGRGSILNPVTICNITQLNEMDGRAATIHYKLADDINLRNFVIGGINQLYGKLDGNNYILYGIDSTADNAAADTNYGIILENHADIKNLNIVGNKIINNDILDSVMGVLAGVNFGTIYNVKAHGNKIEGEDTVGGLIGYNAVNGAILNSKLEFGRASGQTNVGGLVGINDGIIGKVEVDTITGNRFTSSSFHTFGGISGVNDGTIEQSTISGLMIFSDTSLFSDDFYGGIAGENGGDILNSYAESQFKLSIFRGEGVGGLVGIMTSSFATLTNSFMLGRIGHLGSPGDALATLDTVSSTDERDIGPLVGNNLVGANITNSYYVPNVYLWDSGSYTVNACPSSSTATFSAGPTASGAAKAVNQNTLGYFDYTRDSSTQISYNPADYTCNIGDQIAVGDKLDNYAEHGVMKSPADFQNMADFATAGYLIAGGGDSVVLNYYLSLMNDLPTPAGTPIWSFDVGDAKHPKLLQVRH